MYIRVLLILLSFLTLPLLTKTDKFTFVYIGSTGYPVFASKDCKKIPTIEELRDAYISGETKTWEDIDYEGKKVTEYWSSTVYRTESGYILPGNVNYFYININHGYIGEDRSNSVYEKGIRCIQ